jgi:TonB family protein
MTQKNFFKLGLLISVAVHFFLIVFFPVWKAALPTKKPRIVEVALITVRPKPEAKRASAPPPAEKEIKKKVIPRVSPVKIAVQPTQKIPVLNPRVETESKLKVAFPTPKIRPVITPREVEPFFKVEKEAKKVIPGSPTYTGLPPKISSPIRGGIPSFLPSVGSEEEGKERISGVKGPVGITFKGLGARKPERAPQPIYPPEMERRGVEGEGKIRIYVAPTGQVVDVEIIRTSGWRAFDKEIYSTLLKWRFTSVDEPGIKSYEGEFYFRFLK